MKYIVYRQPVDAQYPWEINKNLFNSDGYILASITNANANIFTNMNTNMKKKRKRKKKKMKIMKI